MLPLIQLSEKFHVELGPNPKTQLSGLVPDTNCLIGTPDPTAYRAPIGEERFTFTLLPTILGDLDRLKFEHRNPDVRDKAKKTIDRIKGSRWQGSLADGALSISQ